MNKEKFNTCKFCVGSTTRTIAGCCFTTVIEGYFCDRKNISKLSPLACINCDLYEKKERTETEESQTEGNISD